MNILKFTVNSDEKYIDHVSERWNLCIREMRIIASRRIRWTQLTPFKVTNSRTTIVKNVRYALLGGPKTREDVSRGSFLSRRKHLALGDAALRLIHETRSKRNKNDIERRRRKKRKRKRKNSVGAQTGVCLVNFSRRGAAWAGRAPLNRPSRRTMAAGGARRERDRGLLMAAMTSTRASTLFPTTTTHKWLHDSGVEVFSRR